MAWGASKLNSGQLEQAQALLRAATAAGDLENLKSLLKAGVDPLSKAPSAEWVEMQDHVGCKTRLEIVKGDCAGMVACRFGQAKALSELGKRPIWFHADGAQVRSASGEDYAMAAVSSKNPWATEALAVLWEQQPGMMLVEVGKGIDGALRQACKSGNAEALVFLANKLGQSQELMSMGGPRAIGEALSKKGRTGRTGLLWTLASGSESAAELVWSMVDKEQAFAVGADGRGAWGCAAESGNLKMSLLCAKWSDAGFGPGQETIAQKDAQGLSAVGVSASIGDLSGAKALWRCALPKQQPELAKEAIEVAKRFDKAHVKAWFEDNAIPRDAEGQGKDASQKAKDSSDQNPQANVQNKMAKDARNARERLAKIARSIARSGKQG